MFPINFAFNRKNGYISVIFLLSYFNHTIYSPFHIQTMKARFQIISDFIFSFLNRSISKLVDICRMIFYIFFTKSVIFAFLIRIYMWECSLFQKNVLLVYVVHIGEYRINEFFQKMYSSPDAIIKKIAGNYPCYLCTFTSDLLLSFPFCI